MYIIMVFFISLLIMQNASCIETPNALPTESSTSGAPSIIPVAVTPPVTETQNTIPTAPSVIPNTQAPATSTTTPPQPIPVTATPQQPVPPVTANNSSKTELTPEIEQEFKTLTTILDDIRATKKELVAILSTLDKKQEEGRAEIVQAQKTAKDILNATQEADAQAQLAKVNENLKKITALETEISNDLTKKFDELNQKINDLINKARASITSLQAKGIALQMIQAKTQTTTKELTDLEKAGSSTSSQFKAKGAQEKTGWDSVVNFCAKVGHRIKRAFKKIKAMVSSSPEIDTPEKKKSLEPGGDTKTSQQDTLGKSFPSIATAIKTNIADIDALKTKLQDNQNKITTTVNELNKQTTGLMTTLNIKAEEKNDTGDPTWKRVSMFIFSEFLDVTAFILNGVKEVCIWLYQKTIGPLISKFTADIQEKIKKEEQKDTSIAQPKETKPVSDLPQLPTPTTQNAPSIPMQSATPEPQAQPATTPEQTVTPAPEPIPVIPAA